MERERSVRIFLSSSVIPFFREFAFQKLEFSQVFN